MSFEDPYTYPGSSVLQNRLDIRDAETLDRVERAFVVQRMHVGVPRGNFDLPHLQAIHRHLFQDIYDWAGEVRTVDITKGRHMFQYPTFIHNGMRDIERRLNEADFLRGLPPEEFAAQAGPIIGDVNHVHPFREGNGRTQLQYLQQLSDQAGHSLSLEAIDKDRWFQASIASHNCDYRPMAEEIGRSIGLTDPSVIHVQGPHRHTPAAPELEQEL